MILSITCDLGRAAVAASVAGILLAASAVARAQAPTGDPVAAQALFKAARERLQAGDYAGGCPKFEASFALQQSPSTMINIAKCREHDGKIASAWDAYQRALALNRETKGNERRKELEALATKGIQAIEPRLPRLRIVIKSPPSGLEVLRDGSTMPAGALGEALPIDPGAHEIVARAPGYAEEKRSVNVAEGKSETLEITLSAQRAPAPTDQGSAAGRVPVWSWVVGAAGLGLAGAGVFFLVDDLAAIRALRAQCRDVPGGVYCPPGYDYASDNARKNRDLPLAIALGSAGIIAIGAAIGGIVVGVSKKPAPAAGTSFAPWIGPGGAGAALSGRF